MARRSHKTLFRGLNEVFAPGRHFEKSVCLRQISKFFVPGLNFSQEKVSAALSADSLIQVVITVIRNLSNFKSENSLDECP